MVLRPNQPLEFIVTTSAYLPSKEQQRLVRSHASRVRVKKRRRPKFTSWILQENGIPSNVDDQYTSIPSRVGWDLSFMDFPMEIQPYMRGDLALALSPMKEALYPPEICLQVDPMTSSWTTTLLTDPLYLHCILFSVEAYLALCRQNSQAPLVDFHFHKTIRLLQARLDSPDDPQSISDPTIMVVSLLGLTAELTGDYVAAKKHLEGLRKMVELRGGLSMLQFGNSRLPAKVCRIDLTLALRFGIKPAFFNTTIPWKPFIAHNERNCNTTETLTYKNIISEFIETLDQRLVIIWKDLTEFSKICNLATQTSHKLAPNTFSEMMTSVLYRLLGLTYQDPVAEAIRVGMMFFAAGIFFQWRGISQRLTYLGEISRKSLLDLRTSERQVPPLVILWLLVIQTSPIPQTLPADILTAWMKETISQLQISKLKQAHPMLKSVMWIEYLHNELLQNLEISDSNVSS